MFPSTPSDDQQLAADSSLNHPHPAYHRPTHLINKVCLEKGFLRGFWVFVLFCLKLLFASLLTFSFRVALNLNSSSPVKCGSLSCFCTAWPQVMILNFPKAFIWTPHLTGIKGKVFAITTSTEVPKSQKSFCSGERGTSLGTSGSPIVTGFVSMKISICFVCKTKHNSIYPMTSQKYCDSRSLLKVLNSGCIFFFF